jgi:acetaldehyde dehydrogenase
MDRIKVAIIGPGNIGSDLMYKVFRSERLEMRLMAGRKESDGIKRARSLGVSVTTEGIDGIVNCGDVELVFDTTAAAPHLVHAPLLREAGKITIDLTPAAVGPYLVPCVNMDSLKDEINVNMVTCGGQATIPIVYAVSRVAGAKYAEIVACIASKSAGPGTRQSLDEFTQTTAKAIEIVGGADKGKAIIILNPAEPPLIMTNTIYVQVKDKSAGISAIKRSVDEMVEDLRKYVPGYRLSVPPILDGDKVTVSVQVEGAGDFLPNYSGNLDIINAAAVAAAEKIALRLRS